MLAFFRCSASSPWSRFLPGGTTITCSILYDLATSNFLFNSFNFILSGLVGSFNFLYLSLAFTYLFSIICIWLDGTVIR